MALFKDAQEVYDTIGKLFQELAADEELAPKFRKANTIVQYEHREPDSEITVRLQEDEPGDVDLGETEMEPEVAMTHGGRHRPPLLARQGERDHRARARARSRPRARSPRS